MPLWLRSFIPRRGRLCRTLSRLAYFSQKGGTSNFALTNQVLAERVWTLDVLQRRQDTLIAKIAQVWNL